jgi:hypothetical protein
VVRDALDSTRVYKGKGKDRKEGASKNVMKEDAIYGDDAR